MSSKLIIADYKNLDLRKQPNLSRWRGAGRSPCSTLIKVRSAIGDLRLPKSQGISKKISMLLEYKGQMILSGWI